MKRKILIYIFSLLLMNITLGLTVDASEKTITDIVITDKAKAVIKEDRSLWMWGYNISGELGDGTTTNSYVSKKIMDGVAQVSLSYSHSAAVKEDGSLWMWGSNYYGQLADGTVKNHLVPQKVMDGVKKVASGDYHSAAIKGDGSLWLWGRNNEGQLGDGTTTDNCIPQKIMDNVAQVYLNENFSAAIKEDGSLWMWGSNAYGKLGNGSNTNSYIPIKIMDNVKNVSLGMLHAAAIKEDGSLWLWGNNRTMQIGDGTTTYSYVPVKVMDDVEFVNLGKQHSAAIKEDGSLWLWGWNYYGQIGDGTVTNIDKPKKILDDVKSVSLADYHSAAIKKDGSLWMWGNSSGGLAFGDESTTSSLVPRQTILSVQSYTVSYNANGGTGAPVAQTKYYDKALTLRTKKPTRANHVFQGWALTKTATKAGYKAGGTYKGNKSVTFYAVWKKKQTITASNKSVVYKCSPFNLNAKASGGGKLTYTSGNKKVATVSTTGKVTVKGYGKTTITIKAAAKGNYLAATKKITVTVKPKKMTLKSVSSPGKKKLNISWTKNATVTGYEVQFSTKKNFSSNTYRRTFAAKIASTKLVSVPNKKTYYVRIRAYKTVNGTKYYGAWSNVKSVWVK